MRIFTTGDTIFIIDSYAKQLQILPGALIISGMGRVKITVLLQFLYARIL